MIALPSLDNLTDDDLRALIAAARARLPVRQTALTLSVRRARKAALLSAMSDNPCLTVQELSERFNLSEGTIVSYSYEAGISLAGRGAARRVSRRPLTDAQRAMVEAYRGGLSLDAIGKQHSITRERVRQIVEKHEIMSGERLDRGQSARAKRVARVDWACEICGAERRGLPSVVARWPSRCKHCRCVDARQIEAWIDEYRACGSWMQISIKMGYPKNGSYHVPRKVYNYLIQTKQFSIIAELWPRGVPPWLIKRYGLPEGLSIRGTKAHRLKSAQTDQLNPLL